MSSANESMRLAGTICNGWDVCQKCKTHSWGRKMGSCTCGRASTCEIDTECTQNRNHNKKTVKMCVKCQQRGLYALDNRFESI